MYELIDLAKQGDKASLDKAVRENEGLVRSVIKRFSGRGCEYDDLYQLGMIGLVKAVRRFDTSYGVKFSTYAVPLITGEIKRFLRDDGMIKVSRHYKEISAKAALAHSRFVLQNGREPLVSELAKETGIDIYTLTEALEACRPCDSIYRTVSDEGKNENYLLDMLPQGEDMALTDKISLYSAVEGLSEREKAIITLRYFMDETQSKVAKRLGISQVQVSRIEKKVLGRLKENLEES